VHGVPGINNKDTIMKNLALISLLLILSAFSAPAQTASDTSGKSSDTSATSGSRQKRVGQKFVDMDGDGIDDRLEREGKKVRRGKDRFVDADGDGICDDRATGLGFRRGAGGSGGVTGGDTKSKGKRQGGKP
jgi:hypothetical protein